MAKFRKSLLVLTVSVSVAHSANAEFPAQRIDPNNAAQANYTPQMNGSQTASHTNAQTIKADGVKDKCTSHHTDYAAPYEKMFDKGPSLMSQCGLGKLIDFNLLKLFDPTGALLDAMQGAICGWANDIYTPFQNAWNKPVSQANQWVSDRNRGYRNWVDDRAAAVYDQLYGAYHDKKTAGLTDIGYPYDTEFSDPSNAPVGSNSGGNGFGSGYNGDNGTSNQGGGTYNSDDYDGDIYVIDQGTGPVILNSSPESTPNAPVTNNTNAIDANEDLEQVYNLFRK